MEGFTVTMALMDAVPVLCFGISMILTALRFGSPLFIAGAAVSTLAGCGKVAWKLILGLKQRNVVWLNRYFVPTQAAGFLMMLVSFGLGFRRIRWGSVLAAVTGFPAAVFFLLWLCGMGTMGWYRKNRFDNSPKANWTAQSINCVTQLSLLLALITM